MSSRERERERDGCELAQWNGVVEIRNFEIEENEDRSRKGKILTIQIGRVWHSYIVEIQESAKMKIEAFELKLLNIRVREEIASKKLNIKSIELENKVIFFLRCVIPVVCRII